jgi:hypothetical protein
LLAVKVVGICVATLRLHTWRNPPPPPPPLCPLREMLSHMPLALLLHAMPLSLAPSPRLRGGFYVPVLRHRHASPMLKSFESKPRAPFAAAGWLTASAVSHAVKAEADATADPTQATMRPEREREDEGEGGGGQRSLMPLAEDPQ